MLELNLDDPFGFHKSIESGEFKLEGVGKLYEQDEETSIDGHVCRFSLTFSLQENLGGKLVCIPQNQTPEVRDRIVQLFKKRRKKVFVGLFRIEGKIGQWKVKITGIHWSTHTMGTLTGTQDILKGGFQRLELGDDCQNYDSCLSWIPNLEFGGYQISKHIRANEIEFVRDKCLFSFASVLGNPTIELKQLKDYNQILERLKQTRRSAITAVCLLNFEKPKSEDEFCACYLDFFALTSFVEGRLVLPIAYWFQGKHDRLVIENLYVDEYSIKMTWCWYSFPMEFGIALNFLFPTYVALGEGNKTWIRNLIHEYVAFHDVGLIEVKVAFLSRIYEKFISEKKLLSATSRVYPMKKSVKRKLSSLIKCFLKKRLRGTASIFVKRVELILSMLIDKPFKDKIKALLEEQGFVYDEKLVDKFVTMRNAVAHGGQLKSSESAENTIVIQHLLWLAEVIILKFMGYKGTCVDRWKHIVEPEKSPHPLKFEKVLDELKRTASESE